MITVECGDGKISDTEELLGKLGSEDDNISNRLRTSCTTPPVQQQSTTNLDSSNNNNNTQLPASNPQENPQSPQQHQLNFEVSVRLHTFLKQYEYIGWTIDLNPDKT